MKPIMIRATPISLGGSVLLGLLVFVGLLLWIAFQPHEPSTALRIMLSIVWIGLLAYLVDAWSEKIVYEDGVITFDSFFKQRVKIILNDTNDILVVHEGLNQERGIISVRFRERDGSLIDWPLGPLWNRHDLELFFSSLEQQAGKKKLFQHVR